MGFHRLISSPPDVPFFILETRKRIFASAVTKDKSLSTFLGRAPRIDSAFCDLPTPFDLDDEEVLLESSRLDAALQDLDRDGWKCPNRKDKPIRPASLIRLRYQQAQLRDKILHLSLGNRTKTFSETLSYVILAIYHALLIDMQDFVRRVSGSVVNGPAAITLQRKRLGNVEPAIMRSTFDRSSRLSLQWFLDRTNTHSRWSND
jgi:hypothetical protein